MMRRTLFVTAVLAFATLLASGCYLEVEDGHPSGPFEIEVSSTSLTDLEVDWTIDDSDSSVLCSLYGVQRWEVWVYGPESRDIVLDCHTNWWSSEADFYDLPVGTYHVTVSAIDDFGAIISSVSTSITAFDSYETLTVNFDGGTL